VKNNEHWRVLPYEGVVVTKNTCCFVNVVTRKFIFIWHRHFMGGSVRTDIDLFLVDSLFSQDMFDEEDSIRYTNMDNMDFAYQKSTSHWQWEVLEKLCLDEYQLLLSLIQ